MKRGINYAYLHQKYVQKGNCVVYDRSYEGLDVKGHEKLPKHVYEAFQEEEERVARQGENAVSAGLGLMQEKQEVARIEAAREAIPLEEKIAQECDKVRQEVIAMKLDAKRIKEELKTRDELLDCWQEISAVQAIINAEAEEYLKDTDWYVTRKLEEDKPIPPDVVDARAKAKQAIERGVLVFKYADRLRAMEMPSREDIKAAILKGGEEMNRIRALVKEVHLKYPKPKRQRSY